MKLLFAARRVRAAWKRSCRHARAVAAEIDAQVEFINATAVPFSTAALVADVFHAELVFPGMTNAIASLFPFSAIAAAMSPSQWRPSKRLRGWWHYIMAQLKVLICAKCLASMPTAKAAPSLRAALASAPHHGPCFRLIATS